MLRGNDVVRVNPVYSSQDCSVCRYRVPKTLVERLHVCPNCGVVIDRDYNAANVIELRAFGTNTVGAGSASNRQVLPANAYGDGTSTLGMLRASSVVEEEAPTESIASVVGSSLQMNPKFGNSQAMDFSYIPPELCLRMWS